MGTPAVDVQNVTHRYGAHCALRAVSMRVEAATLYGLLGPNGSGKTTLFRILSTLMPPSEGQAHVFGMDVEHDSGGVRNRLGVVFQAEALDENLTVRENLRFQSALYGLRGAERRDRIDELLGWLDVSARAGDRVSDLSGGLRRRVDLARGLLHRPDLLLLDEPTSGLDPAARRTFWDAVQGLQDSEGTTLLVATHLMEEADRCDRLGILSDGELVVEGAPSALKADLGDETLWLETDHPAGLCDRIEAQFGAPTRIVGSMVQVAPADPPAFLAALYEAMGRRIRSATLRTPTLEDVFMVHAGVSRDLGRGEVLARRGAPDDVA